MRCSRCRRENPAENAYCGGCGTALPATGASEPAAAAGPIRDGEEPEATEGPGGRRRYTPRHLTRGPLGTRSALQGERKRVTVLFADIKSSTRIAGALDPEEWHRILDRFFAILTEVVHRYRGTVNQYTGDGIMALFGAPLAQDEHARWACDAALEIQSALRGYQDALARQSLTFGVRIGLNTGEVVVGKIGDALRMDYTAQGQTVGLASRTEESAPAGAIHLTADTAVEVEGYFELESLGAFTLHGANQPIELFALLGRAPHRSRLDLARARGLAPLVGRELELAELHHALQAAGERKAEVVSLVGPPGVGKSRLCLQMTGAAEQAGFEVCVVPCPPHGSSIPFGGARALLAALVGAPTGGTALTDAHDQERRAAIGSHLERIGKRELKPWIEELLELPRTTRHRHPHPLRLDENERRERFGNVLRQLVQADRGSPLLVWIDDAHWIDDESQRVLSGFIDALGWTCTLVLIAHRPELEAPWPKVSYRRELRLGPLAEADASALVESWLGGDPEVGALQERILAATSGTPFFVEEVIRELVRGGALEGDRGAYRLGAPVAEIAIPSSVQDAVAARIDALPENDKQLLQLASAIGHSVSRAVLETAAEREALDLESALPLLGRMELLHSGPAEDELRFEHALTREVAYAAQLQDVRRERHAEIARAIEQLHADHIGPQCALIAHHWEAAGATHRARRWRQRAAMQVSQIQIRRIDRSETPSPNAGHSREDPSTPKR